MPKYRRRCETVAGTATLAQAIDAEVITEAGGGRRSLGFGIVTFPSQNQLERALADMNGFEVSRCSCCFRQGHLQAQAIAQCDAVVACRSKIVERIAR